MSNVIMSITKKVVGVFKHPQTKIIMKKIQRALIKFLKTKIGRGITLLYLSGLFMELGLIDLSVACSLALIIDNRAIVTAVLFGSTKRKRRYN